MSHTAYVCTLWHRAFHRSAVVIINSTRDQPSTKCGDGRGRDSTGTGVGVSEGVLAESEMAEAKQKLHLLTLQTLKYSTLWIIHRVSLAVTTARMSLLPHVHCGSRYYNRKTHFDFSAIDMQGRNRTVAGEVFFCQHRDNA